MDLSEEQKALLWLLVYVLPAIIVWAGLGLPTDKAGLAILVVGVLTGILAFVKDLLGIQSRK